MRRISPLLVLLVVAAGCAAPPDEVDTGALAASFLSLDELDRHVAAWDGAATLDEAQAAASLAYDEATRLLPARDGDPQGLVRDAVGDDRCARDAIGALWDDPGDRWAEFDTAVAEWSDTNNTYPSLESHLMRVMGWASIAMDADDLAYAVEKAFHAQLHVDISRDALEGCRA